jgi:hypothetical protein
MGRWDVSSWLSAGARAAAVAGLAASLAAVGAGCGGGSTSGAQDGGGGDGGGGDTDVAVSVPWTDANGVTLAPAVDWPEGTPADIPPFPGRVVEIMPQRRTYANGLEGVRMFLTGVTRDQFVAYVVELRGLGYDVTGIVYYTNDSARGAAQAQAAAGNFDAIKAVKGDRTLTITAPTGEADEVTFDADGLTKAESATFGGTMPGLPSAALPTATPVALGEWPADWANRLPQPHGCSIGANAVMVDTPTTLAVVCSYPDDDPQHHQAIVAAYKAELLAAGFIETGEMTAGAELPGGVASLTFEKGSLTVSMITVGGLTINAMER